MDCNNARSTLRKLHAPMTAMVVIGEGEAESALTHVDTCNDCKLWFHVDMCNFAKERYETGSLDEGVLEFHNTTHRRWGSLPCLP